MPLSVLTFPGSSPSRDLPNPHPYAIKTSSSAVLTRSNSTGHRSTSHHYTPISPCKNPIGIKESRYVSSHKHTSSLPSGIDDPRMTPPPVHMPPSSTLPARLANQGPPKGESLIVSEGEGIPPTPPLTWRVKRSETLPSVFPNRSDTEISVQDLPMNPKVWSPAQLSVHLSSALRMKGGAKLPLPVVRDIGMFVMKEHLSGRAFLRMKKEDYDALGINQLWKDALLGASRSLRQNLVQGRIMGFESGPPQTSLSTEELLLVPEEENILSSSPLSSPLDPIRHTSSSPFRQWEEDRKRMNKSSFRAGRVRGMVETYERSFSESSGSGGEFDEQENSSAKLDRRQLECELEDEGGFASEEDTSVSEDEGDISTGSANRNINVGSELSSAKADAESKCAAADVDLTSSLPSVEALLKEHENNGLQNDRYRSWGAKAWEDEADNGPHATARRVPLDHTISQKAKPCEIDKTASPSGGSVPKDLTELFSQLAIDDMPAPKSTKEVGVSIEDVNKGAVQTPVAAAYELLKEFQKRLEIVEKRLDEMEHGEERKEELHGKVQTEDEQECKNKAIVLQDDVDVGPGIELPLASDMHDPTQEEERQMAKNDTVADLSISELPRYMFLVSLGVAAITTRVVLNRVLGDRKRI